MTCKYTICPVQENNNYYIGQALYMVISAVALVNFPSKIDPLAIILLLFPSVLDMIFTRLTSKWLNNFKRGLLAVDFILVLLGVLGEFSLIEYTGDGFRIPSSAVLFPGLQILNMKIIAAILFANIVPPLLFYFGYPCKKNLKHVAETEAAAV